jgi:capsular polysaccharide biosynthesis protein
LMQGVVRVLKDLDGRVGLHVLSTEFTVYLGSPSQEVGLPPVIDLEQDREIDEERLPKSYKAGPVYLISARNCLVDRDTGYCWTSDGSLIAETLPTLPYEVAAGRAYAVERPASGRIPTAASGILLSSARHQNYYHWWTDCLVRHHVALSHSGVFPGFQRSPAITPVNLNRFQRESLDLLGIGTLDGDERFVAVDELLIPCGINHRSGQRLSCLATSFAGFLQGRLGERGPAGPAASPPRIYVSRSSAPVRRLVNEDRLMDILAPFGFVNIDPAGRPLREQIALFGGAHMVISPHGAGLTNLLFSKPDTTVVEIFSRDGLHSSSYRRLSRLLGINYRVLLGQMVPSSSQPSRRKAADRHIALEPETLALVAGSLPRLLDREKAAA